MNPWGSAGVTTAPGIGGAAGATATGATGTPGAAHDARLIAMAIPPTAKADRTSLRMTLPPRNALGTGCRRTPAAAIGRFILLCRCSSLAVLTDYTEWWDWIETNG
jgi:hypothetical protein